MNTLALADPRAELATVGGKGESLARLAVAGLPVPDGFHVTTAAYRDFVDRHNLQDKILSGDADEIATLFAAHEMPAETAGDILAAYAAMGEDPAVAVRSSATAEDLPGMSFAGQQDSYLNISGTERLLDAVKRCWASLWTERAIAYRKRNGIPQNEVAIAVVVQELVPADAAGVLFTEDRLSPGLLTVNAAWGLGEAVVGGLVTPDTITLDRAGRTVVTETIASKAVMTVRTPGGTAEEPVPLDRRDAPVLSAAQAAQLAGLGMTIEELYGCPMDVEWAIHDAQLYILQARPITGQREVWNDSLKGDYLWSNGNLGEAIPSVMTPCTWSLVQAFMSEIMILGDLGGHPICGNIGGRVYMNMSLTASLGAALGITKKIKETQEPVYGRLPEGIETPRLPMSRWQTLKAAKPMLGGRRAVQQETGRLPEYIATVAQRIENIRDKIAAQDDLVTLWENEVEPQFRESNRMLACAARQDAGSLVYLGSQLEKLVGEVDANALMTGLQGSSSQLESLGPLLGLARIKRGELSRDAYARRYGHRCPDEFEVSIARPVEDPAWIDRQLAALTTDPAELLGRQEEANTAAWQRFRERHPRKAEKFRRKIDRWTAIVQAREDTRSEMMRGFWMVRDFVLRAGELTGQGDDLFFLTIEEILEVLGGSRRPLSRVATRRATYALYQALPRYPGIIRGRFDPERWAADPDRRGDVFDAAATVAPPSQTVSGIPGSAGVVEGTARVIASVADGDRLGEGEILVTTVTNVGWTLLFPRAAAVVTDVGAPLSHATIVARELGIPAVVGTRNATMLLRDGDRIRVDGTHGTVEVITTAVPALS